MEQALEGFTVIELGDGVPAAFCTRWLAGLGAKVIKVEPPGGDWIRRQGPFAGGAEHPERGALHLWLDAGKQSIVLDLDHADGRQRLATLIEQADALIEHLPPGRALQAGVDDSSLLRLQPRITGVALRYFGRGPYEAYEGTDLTAFGMGGQMAATGDPGREPLKPGGYQADCQLGLNGFAATLAGLWLALESGRGQTIEVSAMECMASTLEHMLCTFAYLGRDLWQRRRGNQPSAVIGLYACLDGYLGIHAMPRNWQALLATMERADLAQDERFRDGSSRLRNNDELVAEFSAWALQQHKREAYARAGQMRGPVAYVHTMKDLLASPQLAARRYFEAVEHPAAGRLRYPGAPFKMSATPWRMAAAPLLGEHAKSLSHPLSSKEWESKDTRHPTPDSPASGGLPLEGVRIADLSAVWAGPYATRLLGDMGAEVIKIESVNNPDMLRSLSMLPPEEPRRWNRAAYFNHNNRNKYGCTLDLASERGRALFLDLVRTSDIVIENFRAEVLDRLNLGYEVLREVRPDIILLSMPGHGKTGPERGYIAYGTNVEQLAGLVSISGYEGGEPHKTGISYGDPISGIAAAGAAITALLYRRRTGMGQQIDCAQREVLTQMLGEFVLGYQMTSVLPAPAGNRHPLHAPWGAYPAAGDDRWLTIAVRDDQEFARLCALMHRQDLVTNPRYQIEEARLEHEDELDATIGAWTSQHGQHELVQALQAAGIAAGPVLTYAQLLHDPHLRARGFFEPVASAEAGISEMEGPVWRFSEEPAHIRLPAPAFGEHNAYLLGSLLGLTSDDLEALAAAGVVGDVPNMATHQ